jgi:hypothetical protein
MVSPRHAALLVLDGARHLAYDCPPTPEIEERNGWKNN